MAEEIVVEPRAGVTPPAEEPEPTAAPELPDELLNIPAMQAIFAGQPAAFSALITDFEKMPEAKVIASNKDSLMRAGFGMYRSLDGAQGVVFNSLHLSPDEVKAADQAGQLQSVAPPFAELNASVAQSGGNNPVLNAQVPTGPKQSASAPVAQVAPLPAGAQKTLTAKRTQNLQLGSPTSGAAPGAGRLLNSILRPVL